VSDEPEIMFEQLAVAGGYFMDIGRFYCEKCNLPYWRPDWHGKVPCQAGCPEPWQWYRSQYSEGGPDKPVPDGFPETEARDSGGREGGAEHVLWVSPCGWRRWTRIARAGDPVEW
jgi:hypothetical protein